ncbi:MAG: hypothetical protein HYR62_03700 [Actinobacteria bacterium]|nr:hypothetical protein [Actinomycetota bacterium]MBI3687704.1 hypothetical protein [Actinomycetota bacterium]
MARSITRSRDAVAGQGRDGPPAGWALLIPARTELPCELVPVPLTAAGISDSIGGGLLEEVVCGPDPDGAHTVYQDAAREMKALPDNPRAARLAARLGWPYLTGPTPLRGDALVLGLDEHGADADVPDVVLAAAVREGLLRG